MDTQTSISESTVDQGQFSDQDFERELGALAARWQTHRGADLRLRHQTGELLVRKFGPPTKRFKRGDGVLDAASKQLQMSLSELSRLRAFAGRFKSFQDFEREHPGASTWTAVKALLPSLRQPPKAKSEDLTGRSPTPSRPARTKPFRMKTLKRPLENLTSKFRESDQDLSDADKKELREGFMALAEAVEHRLGIRVSVDDAPVDNSPPAAPDQPGSAA